MGGSKAVILLELSSVQILMSVLRITTEVNVIILTVHTLASVTKAGRSQKPTKIKPSVSQLMNVRMVILTVMITLRVTTWSLSEKTAGLDSLAPVTNFIKETEIPVKILMSATQKLMIVMQSQKSAKTTWEPDSP